MSTLDACALAWNTKKRVKSLAHHLPSPLFLEEWHRSNMARQLREVAGENCSWWFTLTSMHKHDQEHMYYTSHLQQNCIGEHKPYSCHWRRSAHVPHNVKNAFDDLHGGKRGHSETVFLLWSLWHTYTCCSDDHQQSEGRWVNSVCPQSQHINTNKKEGRQHCRETVLGVQICRECTTEHCLFWNVREYLGNSLG